MSLTSAKLGDQRHHRRSIYGLAGESTQHHAGMLTKRPCKASSGKEFIRITVIFRGGLGDNLLQVNGKFIRIERPALTTSLRGNAILYQGSMNNSYFIQ
jgi:hypothetical protein